MKKYINFLNEKKDIWQRKPNKDETYGPIYYIKRDFKSGVYDGDIVKLDRKYIENLDDISWRLHKTGKTNRKFTDEEYDDFYTLINYEWYYGYALRKAFSNIVDLDIIGWVPTGYIRHLTKKEKIEYKNKKEMIETINKYNL